ncbi:MAG: hypothetical protein ACI93N_001996 [Flavobacteriaceae bacterium]|jgi:hypothetical protein
MKNNYQSISFLPFAGFYLLLSLLLWWFRAPNIDEPWMGGLALSLERYGAFFDLGHLRSGKWKIFFFGESYYTCLFLWMKIFGNNLLVGRLMSVFMGLGSLFIVHIILNKHINHKILTTILLLIGGNYFFLLANTQVRSETWCLLATMLSLHQMYLWIQNGKKQQLFLSHIFLILATFGHFQAAFVGLSAWSFTFFIFQKRRKYSWIPFLSPYVLTAIIYTRYLYNNKDSFFKWYAFYFGKDGDMAGHSGGMIGSAFERLSNGNWEEFVIILGLVIAFGVGNLMALFYNRKNPLLILIGLYGLGGYASWLLTTTNVNDYHASWLIFPFLSILTLNGNNNYSRLVQYGNLSIFIALFILGLQWTYTTVNENPRANFEGDIKYIKSSLKNEIRTIYGPRDIMWSFDFDENIFDPKYYTDMSADIIVFLKFRKPIDIPSYRRYDGNHFIIFIKE